MCLKVLIQYKNLQDENVVSDEDVRCMNPQTGLVGCVFLPSKKPDIIMKKTENRY